MSRRYTNRGSALGSLNAVLNLASGESPAGSSIVDEIHLALTGTWVGTVSFQGGLSPSSFAPITAKDGTGAQVSSATGNGLFIFTNVPQYVRIQITAYTSGTVAISYTEVAVGDK